MRKVIIFGGTGTLAKATIPILLQDPQIERIRIFARNDHRIAEMIENDESLKLDGLVGDIRDPERVSRALKGCDSVFHFAAMKRVEQAEYNPGEAILTNVIGTQNIIRGCSESETAERAIFTSTDKAVSPLNVYGISKSLAEKIWIQGNIGVHRAKFSCCRYGNVLGSHGSVLELWRRQLGNREPLSITDGEMTRFFLTPSQAAEFVISGLRQMNGGEIFIPRMKSTTVEELAKAFVLDAGEPDYLIRRIAPRPGEKRDEALISHSEIGLTTQISDRIMIRWPEFNLFPVRRYGNEITEEYTSDMAERFTEPELLEMLKHANG